jgi:hypothetical protein
VDLSISATSFAPKIDFPTGTHPWSVAIGDLDGDGKADLAVANANSSTVSVYRNTSSSGSITTASFAPKVDFTTGSLPYSVAIGDLDGDGKADLAVVNNGSTSVSVFRNTSSGGFITEASFATKVDFTTGSQPTSAAIGDLDGDGKADLAVTNQISSTVSVFRNTSSIGSITAASFAAKVDFITGVDPYSIAIGDFDGDGKADLAVANYTSSTVSVFRNTSSIGSIATASFAAKVDFTAGTGSISAAIGDLDGDGKADLAVANYNNGAVSTVSIFRNTSSNGSITTASFATKVDFTAGSAPFSLSIGDLDGDGKADLAVANRNSNTVSVIRNNPVFATPPTITSFSPSSGAVGATITITGTNFSTTPTNNVIVFGATRAAVTAATETQLTVTVPIGATYAPITVLNTATGLLAYSKSNFTPTFAPNKGSITTADFNPKVDFTTGALPVSLAIGDLDGDGKADLAVANYYSNTVSVYLNTSSSGSVTTNSFASKVDFATGDGPWFAAIGDLDGDGKADLAVVNKTSSTVSVYRNTGSSGSITTASFAPKVDFDTGFNSSSVAIGDLDGDGKADLAVTNYSINTVSVYRNTSSSGSITSTSFATKVDFTTGSNPISVAIGDLDGDGKPDLAVANRDNVTGNTVSVFRNTSSSGSITTASFDPKVDFTSDSPVSVAIGDLDGDGKADLAVANAGNTISVIRNTSTSGTITAASFAPKVDFATGTFPQDMAIGDLDGDGKVDLAVTNQASNKVSLYRNTSTNGSITTASFAVKVELTTGGGPGSLSIGDLDGDGKADLAVTNLADNTISVIRNNPLGPPIISIFSPASGSVGTSVTISGSNFSATPANNVVVFGATRATVTAATSTQLTVTVPAGATYAPITVLNTTTGLLAYSKNNFTPTFSPNKGGITAADFNPKVDFTAGANPWSVAIGDLDGDGKADLAVTNYSSNAVSVYRNTSSIGSINAASFAPKVDFTTGSGPFSASIGDLDGDGKPDLVVANRDNNTVSVFRNKSISGSITSASFAPKVDFTAGGSPISVSIGDLDGDGKADLAVPNLADNTISVCRNTGSSRSITNASFAPKVDFATGTQPIFVAMGDIDGDDLADLAVANYGSTTVSVYRNAGNSGSITTASFVPKVDFTTGVFPYSVSIGDLDGDGKADLVVANNGNATVSLYRNTSSSGAITTASFAAKVDLTTGDAPTFLAMGDLDGDSKVDLAVANRFSNTVSVIRNMSSSGSITASSFAAKVDFITGTQPIFVAINDLDGDGKADLAVANYGSNTVSVIRNNLVLSQSITFAALPAKTFGDANFAVLATASSGLPVTYSSSNTAVATIAGSTVTIVGGGTSTITASQAGNDFFAAAPNVTQTLTVNKATQSITFATFPTKTFGDASFTLSATASSGLPITYTSSNTSVATIAGSTVTIVGGGTSTITASQAGNDSFASAANVTQTLTVNKASQAITFAALPAKTFGDASFTLSATTSSGLPITYSFSNTAVATVSGNTVTVVGVGTSTITASQTGNDSFAAAANITQTLTVNKASQTITFATLPAKTFGDANFTLSATTSSGLPAAYTSSNTAVATISGNSVTIVGVGTSTITANQAGNDSFNSAANVTQTLAVNKASQTITFATLSAKTFGDANFTLSTTASSGLPITYSSSNTAVATVSGNTVTVVGVGTSTITASQAGNDSFAAAANVNQTLTVNKASQTITFAALPAKTYADTSFALSATTSSGLPVAYTSSNTAVATISGNSVTIVGFGTSTITASQAGNDSFNSAANVTQTLTVNKASQTITFAALPAKTYGDASLTLSATTSSGLPINYTSSNTAVATISGNSVTIVGVGTSTITASQAGNDSFNSAANVTQTLTVNKASQAITFTPLADKTLGDAAFALTGVASSNLVVAFSTTSDKITISGTQVTLVKAGRTSIVASQGGNDSFNPATSVTQNFCIKPAKPTITTANNTGTVILTSNAAAGNQWYLAGNAISGGTNQSFSATASGVYKVQVTADDCVSEFSAEQPVVITGDIKQESYISISPNPVEEVLQVNGIVGEVKSTQLFDMTGRASLPLELEKTNDHYQTSVEHLSPGVYLLRILLAESVAQVKFIKK